MKGGKNTEQGNEDHQPEVSVYRIGEHGRKPGVNRTPAATPTQAHNVPGLY